MPYSIDEIILDGGEGAALLKKIKDEVAAIPPGPVSAEAWGKLIGSVAPELGALVDQIRAHIAS